MRPVSVPSRPVWLGNDGLLDADWHQQRLLSVTQGTLEMARGAMLYLNSQDANHLYSWAIKEINQVIAAEGN